MKTYKDIYEFPLHQAKYGSWVYDKIGNFVFQFEPRFDEKGQYEKGWKEFEQNVLNCLNEVKNLELRVETIFTLKEGNIFITQNNNTLHIITIRGWGNLTGIGAHNLSGEEASNIQDTFAEFILNKLNNYEKI